MAAIINGKPMVASVYHREDGALRMIAIFGKNPDELEAYSIRQYTEGKNEIPLLGKPEKLSGTWPLQRY